MGSLYDNSKQCSEEIQNECSLQHTLRGPWGGPGGPLGYPGTQKSSFQAQLKQIENIQTESFSYSLIDPLRGFRRDTHTTNPLGALGGTQK